MVTRSSFAIMVYTSTAVATPSFVVDRKIIFKTNFLFYTSHNYAFSESMMQQKSHFVLKTLDGIQESSTELYQYGMMHSDLVKSQCIKWTKIFESLLFILRVYYKTELN